MERNANYALVGLISAIILCGLAVFVVWLAGSGFSQSFDTYNILFKGPVRGLNQGGEVHFNGIKVGDVTRIYLDPKDATMVVAETRVTSDVPVREDSTATLEPQGITGVNYIQITAGTPNKPLLKADTPEGQVPMIHTRPDTFSNLLAGGGDVVQRAVETLDRVNRILSDDNIKTLTATLNNFKDVSAELAKRKSIIDDAQKTVQDADVTLAQVRELAKSSNGLVNGDGKRALGKLADAATEIEASAKSLKDMTDSLKGPTGDFASNGLPQMTSALISLQRATEHMDQMITQIQNNPRGLVSKAPAKEIEVKP